MRIAVIADVHGNLLALRAVLDEILGASPDLVVNLGDLVSGPFDPAGAAEAQMATGHATVRGNHDRWVVSDPSRRTDAMARAMLSPSQLSWLAGLPETLTLANGEVFACHGSPAGGDTDYLLEDVGSGRAALASEAEISARLAGTGTPGVVLCGHTHVQRAVSVGGTLVVNPGSVGWPAYSDTEPVFHLIEAGSPHARYAVLTRSARGWSAELRAAVYDWEGAARQAEAAGRADVAHAVRTGRVYREAAPGTP